MIQVKSQNDNAGLSCVHVDMNRLAVSSLFMFPWLEEGAFMRGAPLNSGKKPHLSIYYSICLPKRFHAHILWQFLYTVDDGVVNGSAEGKKRTYILLKLVRL